MEVSEEVEELVHSLASEQEQVMAGMQKILNPLTKEMYKVHVTVWMM